LAGGVQYSRNNTITIWFNKGIAQITSESARKEGEPANPIGWLPYCSSDFFLKNPKLKTPPLSSKLTWLD
jgi:hypothetical protein